MNHLHFLVLQSQFSPNYTSFKNCRILCPFSGQMVCAKMAIHKNSKDCRQKEYLLLDQLLQLGGGGRKSFQTHKPPESISDFFNFVNCSNKKYYLSLQILSLFYPSTSAAAQQRYFQQKNNCICTPFFHVFFIKTSVCSLSYNREVFFKYFQKRTIFMIITFSFYLLQQKSSLLHSAKNVFFLWLSRQGTVGCEIKA